MSKITAFRVTAGSYTGMYATEHHAEQMARALTLHGHAHGLKGFTPKVERIQLPNDALTRLTVRRFEPAAADVARATGVPQ